MELPSGIKLYINRELGANAYKISVYKYGVFVGWLIGYINHRSRTIACYPFRRLERGTFRADELPVRCAVGDIPWERRGEVK